MRIYMHKVTNKHSSDLEITVRKDFCRVEHDDKVYLTDNIEGVLNNAIDDGYRFVVIE